jgi:predicted permease
VERLAAFHDDFTRRVLALPGVRGAALTSVLPLTNVLSRADFTLAGRPPLTPADTPSAQNRVVSAGYFEALGIPRVAGRTFMDSDDARAPAVAIIDAALARRHFPGTDPLGTRLNLDDGGGFREVTIVGVVGAVKLAAPEDPPAPTIYVPFTQLPPATLGPFIARVNLVVKAEGNLPSLEHGLRDALKAVDRDVSLSGVRTMQSVADDAVAARRFNLTLMAIFAGAAALLAASGLYALIAGTVAARTREIAIRLALGARRADVLGGVLSRSARLATAGLGLGLLGSFGLARLLSGLLYEVRPGDPGVLAGMTLLLGSVAIGASLLPALRATRVDPAEALRAE